MTASLEGEPGPTPAGKTLPHSYPETRFRRERARNVVKSGYINGQQIEAARQNIRRKIKREGKLEIPILTDIPISRKPTAARMGKGKGKVNNWVASLPAGKPLFLLYGISEEVGLPALQSGANKLPFKIKIYKL